MALDRAPAAAFSHLAEAANLPAPHTGAEERPAGDWAIHIQALPYHSVRGGLYITSSFLRYLVTLPPRREPMLRYDIHWDAFSLNKEISKSAEHVEAIFTFMVGHRAELECSLCQNGRGVFPFCVVVGYEYGQSECSNCIWQRDIDGCWLLGERGQQFSEYVLL
ncbi:hypothetical protein N7453_006726 [Penicillium expansum]|nr:hypothetical protein N7453_006726 [Penicillium expansum]